MDITSEVASLQDRVKALTEELAAACKATSAAEAAAASAAEQHVRRHSLLVSLGLSRYSCILNCSGQAMSFINGRSMQASH